MPRGNRRVYDLSENVVPAQGAEALVDTPSSESPTDTTSGERGEQQTDPTSLDSNPFDEAGTRKPDHRVDVTTLAKRRQQAKSLIPPRLTNNEFSDILGRIDRLSSANPTVSFDRVVVSGVKDYCYRANRNELNVLAAVLPILIRSGNFDLKDRDVLIGLNSRVSNMRRNADDPSGGAPAGGGDPMSAGMGDPAAGGTDPSQMNQQGIAPGGGGGLTGPANDAGDSAGAGIMGDLGSGLADATGQAANAVTDNFFDGAGLAGGIGDAAGTAADAVGGAASQAGGMAGDAMSDAFGGGGPVGTGTPKPSGDGGGLGGVMDGIGSGISDLMGGGADYHKTNPLAASVQKNRRRASRIAKLILAGKGRYDQLSSQDQHLVTAWVHHTADNDADDVSQDMYRREASAGSYNERAKMRAQARRAARLILAGKATFDQLNDQGKFLVTAWARTADDDGDNGPSKTPGAGDSDSWNGVPGKDENDKDNRQDPHGDGGSDEGMLSDNGDGGQYGEVSTDATPGGGPVDRSPGKDSRRRAAGRKQADDSKPDWLDDKINGDDDSDDDKGNPFNKDSRQRRRADDNMDVAQKDTDSVDVEAPVEWTTERGESSQFDRGEYDQNGPILGEGGAPQPDKSTDQNWPPKASAVDSIRLADMYVDLGLIPADKKYEVVAGFEGMSSIIVKDRLRVLAVVQDSIAESRKANRNRSMVPQSEKNTNGSRMPTMGRGSSIKNNGHNDGLTHFLAL